MYEVIKIIQPLLRFLQKNKTTKANHLARTAWQLITRSYRLGTPVIFQLLTAPADRHKSLSTQRSARESTQSVKMLYERKTKEKKINAKRRGLVSIAYFISCRTMRRSRLHRAPASLSCISARCRAGERWEILQLPLLPIRVSAGSRESGSFLFRSYARSPTDKLFT